MTKKQEKQKKVWYYVQDKPILPEQEEIYPIDSLHGAWRSYLESDAPDIGAKAYAFKIELLGEVENTIKIK